MGEPAGPVDVKVKICGVTRVEDARVAIRAGADFVGAILSPGFGRSVPPDRASGYLERGPDEGAEGAGESAGTSVLVAVLVDPAPHEAAALARQAGAGVLQLHGDEPPEVVTALRGLGPWAIWKAVRVADGDDVRRAVERYGELVDGLLLDGAAAGERGGGHGVRFPWDAAEDARAALAGLTFVAAGGLDPRSVDEVVRRLRPDVVDVSSGVERSPGIKDASRVTAFVRNARAASGS